MPDEWAWVFVPVVDPAFDGIGQVGHAAVRAAPEPLRGQFREPALDQVHPGAVGGCEVKAEAGMALEPALDLGGAVGGDVVQDDMHREFVQYLLVNQVEEAPELSGPVSRSQVGDHVSRGDPASSAGQVIERHVQIGRPVTHVAAGLAAGHAGQHRPRRSRAIERLDLGLLVHAQDDRGVVWLEIETGLVPHFVDELRVRRQLELLDEMGLEAEGAPDPGDGGLRHAHLGGH